MSQNFNFDKIIKQSSGLHEVRESFYGETRISIFVLCYNHKKYLPRFFESVLSQRVNCGVEIIVNDDCSTDGSQDIIIEYQHRYPKIIKPIIRKENLYYKDREKRFYDFMELANGLYFAFCESDDYFTDPFKLFLQSYILDSNPNIDFCTHKVEKYDIRVSRITNYIPFQRKRSDIFEISDIANTLYCAVPFQLSSYFCRASCFPNFLKVARELQKIATFSDISILMFCSKRNGLFYIDRPMSRYHFFIENSWTSRTYNSDIEKMADLFKMNYNYYLRVSEYFNGKTQDLLKKNAYKNKMLFLKAKMEYKSILNDKKVSVELKKYSLKDYISIIIIEKHPRLFDFLHHIKSIFK